MITHLHLSVVRTAGNGQQGIIPVGRRVDQGVTVGKGLKVNLFASEKEFPNWPSRCRWIRQREALGCRQPTYPLAKGEMNDKI